MLNTKIIGVLMALAMFTGVGALAADSAAPMAPACHQKECKNVYMPVCKDPRVMYNYNCMPVNKNPCNPVWNVPCKPVVKDPNEWKNPCHSICKNHTPTVPIKILL